jgi:hypothetical protein
VLETGIIEIGRDDDRITKANKQLKIGFELSEQKGWPIIQQFNKGTTAVEDGDYKDVDS